MDVTYTKTDAVLSPELNADGRPFYRYLLTREWSDVGKHVLWVMLNPSEANSALDDATVRRIVVFSNDWGYGGISVANLFAYRTNSPAAMAAAHSKGVDIIGPSNDGWIEEAAEDASLIVCAWGKGGALLRRSEQVLKMLERFELSAMLLNNDGSPSHPLYLPKQTTPFLWRRPPTKVIR